MELTLIAARSKNDVIGWNGQLPWKLPMDLKKFRGLTTGKVIIMGRKTFESIGSKPLPNRVNIVISRDEQFANKHLFDSQHFVFDSLQAAMHFASQVHTSSTEVLVIGGASLYKESLPIAKRIYLSTVDVECSGDVFFPAVDMNEWVVKEEETFLDPGSYLLEVPEQERKPLSFTFQVLERKRTDNKEK